MKKNEVKTKVEKKKQVEKDSEPEKTKVVDLKKSATEAIDKMKNKAKKPDRAREIKEFAEKTKLVPYYLVGYESNGYKVVSVIPSAADDSLFVTFECVKCGKRIPLQIRRNTVRNLKCDVDGTLAKVVGVLEEREDGNFESLYIISNSMYRALYKKCGNEETRMKDIADFLKGFKR